MNELQTEINELKGFIAELKADRQATKDKEKREAWTKYVSLTIVIVAVVAAVANQWAGKFGSRNQMSQIKASDQWSFYEAKSIKQHLDEDTLALIAGRSNDPVVMPAAQKLVADLARYDKEKKDIQTKAQEFEKKRDEAGERGGMMATSVSLFTVAIAAASICTVTKKKPLWFLSLVLSILAVAQMVRAVI